jgi:hypothetical protein
MMFVTHQSLLSTQIKRIFRVAAEEGPILVKVVIVGMRFDLGGQTVSTTNQLIDRKHRVLFYHQGIISGVPLFLFSGQASFPANSVEVSAR